VKVELSRALGEVQQLDPDHLVVRIAVEHMPGATSSSSTIVERVKVLDPHERRLHTCLGRPGEQL